MGSDAPRPAAEAAEFAVRRAAAVVDLALLALHPATTETELLRAAVATVRDHLSAVGVAVLAGAGSHLEVLAAVGSAVADQPVHTSQSGVAEAHANGVAVERIDPVLDLTGADGWTFPLPGSPQPAALAVATAQPLDTAARTTASDVARILGHAAARSRRDQEVRGDVASFRALAEQLPDTVFRFRTDGPGRFEYLNPRFEELTGLDPTSLDGDPHGWLHLVPEEDRPAIEPAFDLRDHHTVVTSEPYRIVRPDGEVRWVQTRVAPERDEDGRIVAVTGSTRDITEAQRTEAALRDALETQQKATTQLRRLGELKSSLLAAVSHELRTPLTTVRGFSELLARSGDELSVERRATAIDAIERNARRLEELLGDLLDLDRLDRGVVEPVRRQVHLGTLVASVLAGLDVGPRLLTVDVNVRPLLLDGPKVERVVENLVVNALTHGAHDGRLWITAQEAADGVTLIVADDGPGVPDDAKERIFEPFDRGDAERDRPGTGIGLSLVKRFVALHDGRVWVEDRDGGGAAFHLWLPDVQAPSAP